MTALLDAIHQAGLPADELATVLDRGQLAGPLVVTMTRWTAGETDELSRLAWRAQTPVVPVRLDGGLVLIGPVLHHSARVCLGCAERARLSVFGPDVPLRSPDLRFGGAIVPALTSAVTAVLQQVFAEPAGYESTVLALRADQLTVSTHRLRPGRQGCPICAPLPLDTADAVRCDLQPQPTTGPLTYRGANDRTSAEGLRQEMFDWRHGPVAHVKRTEQMPLPLVTAELSGDSSIRESGYGRAGAFADAERVAFFEAAERLTGMRPHARATTLTTSYAEQDPEVALDPARLGLHDPAYYGHPQFRMRPYHPQAQMRWVHGWSLPRRQAVTVPEHVAYWGLHRSTGPRYIYESSNGCGLGNSLAEAILYGLYEVAERDAFLLAWYAQTPLRQVAVPADDPVLPHLVDRLDAVGYDLYFFDATTTLAVPSVLALVLHRDPTSPAPQALFAAGAHPDPRSAMRSAAAEAVVDALVMPDVVRAKPRHLERERLLPMLDDPTLVLTLDDHVALNTLPEARPRYEFLLSATETPGAHWRDLWPGHPAEVADLSRLLAETTERLADQDLEVIAVDQTDPVLAARLGLHSAKVIVPGTLPMTFGHLHHRTRGLQRLLDEPHRLGRLPAPLRYDDLSLYPHPFP